MAARIDEFLIGVKQQREWGWLVIRVGLYDPLL